MAITSKGMNKLAKFHGLDPEKHTDSDVDDAIKNSVTEDDLDDLQNRAKAGDDALAALVDQDLEKYSNRIGTDKDALASWKQDLLSNRASTLRKLEAIPAPAAPVVKAPLHSRAGAGTPAPVEKGDTAALLARNRENALIKNRASDLVKAGAPEQSAWLQAAKEIPEEIAAGLHK